MTEEKKTSTDHIPFEEALNRVGFGWYSYIMVLLAGFSIVAFVCIGYAGTIIVPVSACELQTTGSQQGILAAGPVVGLMLGGVLWGFLADTQGRRKMMLVATIGGAIINGLASLSVNWIMLLIMQVIASLFASGLYSMSMTILSESMAMAKRNVVVLLVSSIFLLSQGIMAVLAIPIIPLTFSIYISSLGIYWNSWRTLMLVYSIPSLLSGIWLFFVQESPKYVFSTGDESRALDILRTIHRINHCGSKGELEVTSLLKEVRPVTENDDKKSTKDQILPIFKNPLLKYICIMTLLFMFQQVGSFQVWLPTIADQFVRNLDSGEDNNLSICGILDMNLETPVDTNVAPCSLNVPSLLIVLAVGVLQSAFNLVCSMVVNSVGRRNLIMVTTSVCGVSGILVNLVPNAIGSAVLFAIFFGGIIVIGLYTAIMVSLFPTNVRALAIAFVVSGGRVAGFASIQILNLLITANCDAAFYVYASLFASSAIIASFLPDDRQVAQKQPQASEETGNKETRETTKDITEL